MSTPMDIDPPAAAAPAENSAVEEVKGKGKEEKPRFEVKKVQKKRCFNVNNTRNMNINYCYFIVECCCSLGLG